MSFIRDGVKWNGKDLDEELAKKQNNLWQVFIRLSGRTALSLLGMYAPYEITLAPLVTTTAPPAEAMTRLEHVVTFLRSIAGDNSPVAVNGVILVNGISGFVGSDIAPFQVECVSGDARSLTVTSYIGDVGAGLNGFVFKDQLAGYVAEPIYCDVTYRAVKIQ